MSETSMSLLARLRIEDDPQAWKRLAEIYTPLLHSWLSRYGLQDADREDLIQDVLMYAAQSLREFEHNGRAGAFRRWLGCVLSHRVQRFWNRRQRQPLGTGDSNFLDQIQELEDPNSGVSGEWSREYDRYVARRLLELAKPHFQESTWRAFELYVLEAKTPEQTAQELGITENAVCIAKSRVLTHLRQYGKELVD